MLKVDFDDIMILVIWILYYYICKFNVFIEN